MMGSCWAEVAGNCVWGAPQAGRQEGRFAASALRCAGLVLSSRQMLLFRGRCANRNTVVLRQLPLAPGLRRALQRRFCTNTVVVVVVG